MRVVLLMDKQQLFLLQHSITFRKVPHHADYDFRKVYKPSPQGIVLRTDRDTEINSPSNCKTCEAQLGLQAAEKPDFTTFMANSPHVLTEFSDYQVSY